MKNAIILHGCCDRDEYYSRDYPSPSNFHWLPWLQKQLVMGGYQCQTPEMPHPYMPDYQAWKDIFDQFSVTEETVLIGHSCGCGFILRWLAESRKKSGKIVFVAPWLDPDRLLGKFLDFALDPSLASSIHVLYSTDETVKGVKESVDVILKTYSNAKLYEFRNKGHFCQYEMGTDEFPELLDIVRG